MDRKNIEPPESHYLNAAEGWIMLGDAASAADELEKISTPLRSHPDVLRIEWLVHAHVKNWQACIQVAQKMTRRDPEVADGWINYANGLFFMKRTLEALQMLISVREKFKDDFRFPYNLACYSCQLSKFPESEKWLNMAFTLARKSGQIEHVRQMAAEDPDLKPYRDYQEGKSRNQ
jgi:tetratricopeptide (TPR) repeat protein